MGELILPKFVDAGFESKWLNLTHEDYHQRTDSVHSSSLKYMAKSAWAYRHQMMNRKPPTPAMKFGTLAHNCILHGQEFLKRYVVMPKFEGLTLDGKMSSQSKAAKEAKYEWIMSLPEGSEIVTQEEQDKILWMVDSFMSNQFAVELLRGATPNVQAEWRDSTTGLLCIMEADLTNHGHSTLVDYKTVADSDWFSFSKTIETLRYDLQHSHYEDGIEAVTGKRPTHGAWITTESGNNFETRVHEVPLLYKVSGRHDKRRAMQGIRDFIKTGLYPQSQTVLEEVSPSPWFASKYERLEE